MEVPTYTIEKLGRLNIALNVRCTKVEQNICMVIPLSQENAAAMVKIKCKSRCA